MTASRPWTYRPFRWLLAGRTTSLLGNAIAPVALAFAVLDLTHSPVSVGLVLASRSITNVALLLAGGVIADRLPRRLVLAGSCAGAAAAQATIAAFLFMHSAGTAGLAALSAVNGAMAAVALPASAALVPQTVEPLALRRANALLAIGINAATIVGTSTGGVLIATLGPASGIAVDAACFAIAALLFSQIRVDTQTPTEASIVRDLHDGWTEFTRRRWVWVVVAQFAVVNAAYARAVSVLGPVVADRTFGRAEWGFVLAAQTGGLLAGAVIAIRWQPHRALRYGVTCMLVCGLPALAPAGTPGVATLVATFFLSGVALEQFGVAWSTSLQENIPNDRLARVDAQSRRGHLLPGGGRARRPPTRRSGSGAVWTAGVACVQRSASSQHGAVAETPSAVFAA